MGTAKRFALIAAMALAGPAAGPGAAQAQGCCPDPSAICSSSGGRFCCNFTRADCNRGSGGGGNSGGGMQGAVLSGIQQGMQQGMENAARRREEQRARQEAEADYQQGLLNESEAAAQRQRRIMMGKQKEEQEQRKKEWEAGRRELLEGMRGGRNDELGFRGVDGGGRERGLRMRGLDAPAEGPSRLDFKRYDADEKGRREVLAGLKGDKKLSDWCKTHPPARPTFPIKEAFEGQYEGMMSRFRGRLAAWQEKCAGRAGAGGGAEQDPGEGPLRLRGTGGAEESGAALKSCAACMSDYDRDTGACGAEHAESLPERAECLNRVIAEVLSCQGACVLP